jgi:hypothetical protein
VAIVSYAGYALVTNLAFLLWAEAMRGPVYLGRSEVARQEFTRPIMQTWFGTAVYLVTAVTSWWLPMVGLSMLIVVWVFRITMSIGSVRRA